MKKVLRKFRQLSSGNVTSIVATLVKIRGQLNKSIEFNNREIVHAEGNIDKSGFVMEKAINKAINKHELVEEEEADVIAEAEGNIEEAQLWLESLPSIDNSNNPPPV